MKTCPNEQCGYEHNHANNARCQRCKVVFPPLRLRPPDVSLTQLWKVGR